MAKKKKQKNSYLPLLSALLGIISVAMIFLTAVNYSAVKGVEALENLTGYTGLQTALGYKEDGLLSVTVFEFSIMNLLPFLLALGGAIISLLCIAGKGSKFLSFISAGCFIASAILFFLYPSFIVLPKLTILVKDNFSLAIGTIIGGIASALAGLCSLGEVMKK